MLLAAFGCTESGRPPAGGGGGSDGGARELDAGAGPDAGGGRDAGPGAVDGGPAGALDAGADPDAGGPDGSIAEGTCPPEGPYGTEPGQVAPDVTLLDCDGVEHSLHELCAHEVSWIFEYTDWCPPCRAFADRAADVYARYEGEDLGAFFIVSEDASFGPPTAELCADIRDRYGLPMTVLYDPTQRFSEAMGAPSNDFHVVMTHGAVIRWTGHYADPEIETQLDAAFGR